MKIVVITESGECAALAGWIAENALNAAQLERWTLDPMPDVAEQVLDALAAQWLLTPADILIFPAGSLGDELATRLAWRLHGAQRLPGADAGCTTRAGDEIPLGECANRNAANHRATLVHFTGATSGNARVGQRSARDGGTPDCPPRCRQTGWIAWKASIALPPILCCRLDVCWWSGQGRSDADAEKNYRSR
ncbi:Uncharacterised protein [Citrobacter freundii]|nr:Uncharacterised protein [Citrobacter freundii]